MEVRFSLAEARGFRVFAFSLSALGPLEPGYPKRCQDAKY